VQRTAVRTGLGIPIQHSVGGHLQGYRLGLGTCICVFARASPLCNLQNMCVLCVHVQLEQAVLKLYLSRYGESNYSAIMRVREMWIARYRNGTLSSAELRKFAMLLVCAEYAN
jgi:hypothetical protein